MSRALAIAVSLLALGCGSRSGLLSLPSGEGGSSAFGGTGGAAGTQGSGGAGGAHASCAFGTVPVVVAAGIARAYAIAVDEDHVFVTSAVDGGALVRIPKGGGEPVVLVSGLGRPRHIVLDAARVWLTSPMDGRVLSVEKDGSVVQVIVPESPGHPEGIARAGDATVWVRQGPGVDAGALLAWESVAPDVTLLASGLDDPGPLVASAGHAYWIDNTSGGTPGIWHFAQATTAVPQMLTPLPAANGNDLALSDTHVYYAMNAEIGRVPRSGGPREPLAAGSFARALALAPAADQLYWVEGGATSSGRLARMPMAGGAPETLATGLSVPRGVALDDACVYWTNQGVGDADGNVMARSR